MYSKIECLEAAIGWDRLADEQDRGAAYARDRGEFDGVHLNWSRQYRDVAESLRKEALTGEPWCSTCMRPRSRCDVR